MGTLAPLKAANQARLKKIMGKYLKVLGYPTPITLQQLLDRDAIGYRVRLIEDGHADTYGFILKRDAEYGREIATGTSGELDYLRTDVYGMAKMCFDHLEQLPVAEVYHDEALILTEAELDAVNGLFVP